MSDTQLSDCTDVDNYVIFKLCGFNPFKNYRIINSYTYDLKHKYIKSIFINDELTEMRINLHKDIDYCKHRLEIRTYLYCICFNLILKIESEAYLPYYIEEIICRNGKMVLKDSLPLTDTMKIIKEETAEDFYKKILNSPTGIKENFIQYEIIFKILNNPNRIVQFMSLYDLLLRLRQGKDKYPSQKKVTDYLKKNKDRFNFISFHNTRKKNKNYREDNFTHLRNQIAHCEEFNDIDNYKKLGEEIDAKLIRNLLEVINDTIIFKGETNK